MYSFLKIKQYRYRINISEEGRRVPYPREIGLRLDKGTAANTTLYVDGNSFDQIVN